LLSLAPDSGPRECELPRIPPGYTGVVMSPQVSQTTQPAPQRAAEAGVDGRGDAGTSARFVTGLTAVGAAVVAAGLLAEPATGQGVAPWTLVGMVALVLLLVSVVALAGAVWGTAGRRGQLTRLGGFAATAALVAVAVTIGMRLFLPLPLQTVLVQFSDLAGRVQIDYCPTLPQSFAGRTTAADLTGTDNVVAVKVTGEVCGSKEFPKGIWLYLARSSITVGVE